MESNIAAADIELASADLNQIDDVLSKITIKGARYPKELQERTGN